MNIRKSILDWHWIFAAVTMILVMLPLPALSQSDSTTGQINAMIVHPVGLNDTADMSFGWLARPASPGMAVIAPAGRRVLSSNLTLIRQDGATSAKIVISGSPNQALGLLVGDIARFGRPGKKIEVLGFTHNAGPFPALDLNGRTTIELGATLHLAADINNGRYRGVFDVIVSNN